MPPATLDRRTVFSWSMYDFANSAFTTLVVTFVYATFFAQSMAGDEITGTAWWTRGVAVSAILIALLSPFMGALADRGGYRKRFMIAFSIVSVVATVMLYFFLPYEAAQAAGKTSHFAWALVWFVIANVAFEMGIVFNNAFLPDIAPADKIGRVSGSGWALGYVGGLLCLVVALIGFVFPEQPILGFSKEAGENIRATNLLVAAWFAVFSLPAFLVLKEQPAVKTGPAAPLIPSTLLQLRRTFTEVRRYRQIVRLLIARLIYNDGLVTIFGLGGIYVGITFGFDFQQILVFGIVINVAAGLGSYIFGFLDDKLGGKQTILLSIIGLSVATLIGALTPNAPINIFGLTIEGRSIMWGVGVLIGIFSGPNQAASRSLLGRFVPPDKENEFYGFYAFSGKATAFLGPFLFGVLTSVFGTQRAGITIVFVLFLVGGLLLMRVDEADGIRLANQNAP